VGEKDIAPQLTREQIADLNRYADTLPFFSTDRKEFKWAARVAGEVLERRDTPETAGREPKMHTHQPILSVEERWRSQRADTDRPGREAFSRGR
jgi:hypothetical protein